MNISAGLWREWYEHPVTDQKHSEFKLERINSLETLLDACRLSKDSEVAKAYARYMVFATLEADFRREDD